MEQEASMDSILRAMVLAPSAHNTQPWKFNASNQAIDVFVEWSRHLTVSDPQERQLYASIGCAIENGVIAAQHEGYSTDVTLFPEGEGKDKPAARLTFTKNEARDSSSVLYDAIPDRRNNRAFFDAKKLDSKQLTELKGVATDYVTIVEDRGTIEQIAKATGEGNRQSLSRQEFKNELTKWIRNSWTRKHDGMPGYALEMPAVISLIAPVMIKKMPVENQEGEKAFQQINTASAVVVVATPGDTKKDFIEAGRLMERVWLQATATGLSVAALAPAIEGSEQTRSQIQQAIGSQNYPQAILRIGYSAKKHIRQTPRRTVRDCVMHSS